MLCCGRNNNNNNSCNYNTRVLNGLSSSFPVRSDCGVKNTNSSMLLQDLGFQWNGVSSSGSFFSQFLHAGGKIKEEMLNSPSTNQDFHPFPSTNHVKNNDSDLNDPSHKLFIKTLINGGDHTEPGEFFNKIYPSINVSDWNLSSPPPPPPPFSNSLDLNLQTPPDLFHSQDSFGIFKQTLSDFHDQIHPPPSAAILPCISSKVSFIVIIFFNYFFQRCRVLSALYICNCKCICFLSQHNFFFFFLFQLCFPCPLNTDSSSLYFFDS